MGGFRVKCYGRGLASDFVSPHILPSIIDPRVHALKTLGCFHERGENACTLLSFFPTHNVGSVPFSLIYLLRYPPIKTLHSMANFDHVGQHISQLETFGLGIYKALSFIVHHTYWCKPPVNGEYQHWLQLMALTG